MNCIGDYVMYGSQEWKVIEASKCFNPLTGRDERNIRIQHKNDKTFKTWVFDDKHVTRIKEG